MLSSATVAELFQGFLKKCLSLEKFSNKIQNMRKIFPFKLNFLPSFRDYFITLEQELRQNYDCNLYLFTHRKYFPVDQKWVIILWKNPSIIRYLEYVNIQKIFLRTESEPNRIESEINFLYTFRALIDVTCAMLANVVKIAKVWMINHD
jgi:hypothetical protein